ncbi:P-loop containing nucleoside triphosphate hydrolase protein [Atractiella rhizophila]|nr:P-loop containing nucleoside triphosphate hydrolase protein [Atractiella rhizophila]
MQPKHTPSIKHFLHFLPSTRNAFFVLLISLLHGGLPTYQTFLLGWSFNAFSDYNAIENPTSDDKSHFLKSVAIPAAQLIAIGIANICLGGLSFWLWNLIGEAGARKNRGLFWNTVASREMAWFDMGMGGESKDGEEGIGAAGLMGRFTKETDDLRVATSNTLPLLLSHLSTFFSCLLVAFIKGPLLSLVVLASVPLVFIVFAVAERAATPRMVIDRDITIRVSGRIERALSNISTVKAFNAQTFEISAVEKLLELSRKNYEFNTLFWGLRIAITQIILLTMFVQGFWFGIDQVKKGKLGPGEAYQVFWACLLLSGSIQQIAFHLLAWERGKIAAAGLMDLIYPLRIEKGDKEKDHDVLYQVKTERSRTTTLESQFTYQESLDFQLKRAPSLSVQAFPTRLQPLPLKRMAPISFSGEMNLKNVTFHYPSRPHPAPPSLRNATLYFAAQEATFVVGGSGSGKSTVAALLIGLYKPEEGDIQMDEQSIGWIDERWLRANVCLVSQFSGVVYNGTVHDNIAVGVAGGGRDPSTVTREEVMEAALGTLVHDFVKELPQGYDTLLSGEKGASLSGGQKQRIALARAWIRDPKVLILDEATSALDISSRKMVNDSIRRWRKNKTTIIITHDLSPIAKSDFVYVMENGTVVQQGFRQHLESAIDSPFHHLVVSQALPSGSTSVDSLSIEELYEEDIRPDHPTTLHPPTASTVLDKRGSMNLWSIFQQFSNEEWNALDSGAPSDRRNSNWLRRISSLGSAKPLHDEEKGEEEIKYGFFGALRMLYETIPNKGLLWTGTFVAIASGALIPVFSSFVGKLLGNLADPGDSQQVLRLSLLTLLIAVLAGVTEGLKYTLLERTSMRWIVSLRKRAYALMVHQEKAWFDREGNKVAILVQRLVKDGEDARMLIGQICVQFLIVLAIIIVGVGWAIILGWKLSLCGVALAPIFYGVVQWQARLSSRREVLKKRSREDLGTQFLELVSNIRPIRSMGLENAFTKNFDESLDSAYNVAAKRAFLCGLANPIGGAIGFFGEGILFIIGAILIRSGEYDFAKMVEVYSLFMFSLTFSAQMLTYIPTFSRSSTAAMDLAQFLRLKTPCPNPDARPSSFALEGRVDFKNVTFAYPSRPTVSVLKDVSFTIHPGQCVGIVGGSGSGKSTLAALLQRLYQPKRGEIFVDRRPLAQIDAHFLRDHIGVVSQQPALFDGTVAENIAYGSPESLIYDINRAAIGAHVSEFIKTLPKGYHTNLGENASLISGGQAQRIAIARALLRPREILLLDECTSALDSANQGLVMDTIMAIKQGRTTLVITHKLSMMQMCDFLLVMDKGQLVQVGSYEQLSRTEGPFLKLVSLGLLE